MILFTLNPLAVFFGTISLGLRRSPSGPATDVQLPFVGAAGVTGAPNTTFAVGGLLALPIALEPVTQFMLPARGVLRELIVRNATPGDDPGADLVYAVRVEGADVALLAVPNVSTKIHRVAINMGVPQHALVSVTVKTPMAGFPGTAPVPKMILIWRPLSAPRAELVP
jgi:hypothetical protein